MYFVISFIFQITLFLEKFTPLAKKITLSPAVTAWTNLTSVSAKIALELTNVLDTTITK